MVLTDGENAAGTMEGLYVLPMSWAASYAFHSCTPAIDQ